MLQDEFKEHTNKGESNISKSSSENVLKKEKGKYFFQGQTYSRNNWYRKMANYLNISKESVSLRRTPDEIRIEYIKTFALKNIKKTTFLMYILPCALFLLLSLTLLIVSQYSLDTGNLMNMNQVIFSRFIAIVLGLFSIGLLIKLIILQHKVIMTGSDKRVKYKHINKLQYQGILDVFKKE